MVIGALIFTSIISGLLINIKENTNSISPVPPLQPYNTSFLSNELRGNLFYSDLDSTGTSIPFCSLPKLWPEYEYRITKTLLSCQSSRNLAISANETSLSSGNPPWRVKIVGREDLPFEAEADSNRGEVRPANGNGTSISCEPSRLSPNGRSTYRSCHWTKTSF